MTERAASAVTVVLLAGGEATRLPGKLYMNAGEVPLLVRVYRNVSPGRPTLVSCKGALPFDVDRQIDAPAVVDRWPLRGPLSGLLSTIREVRTPWLFAAAGDAPFVDAALIDALEAQIQPGDEAIVPRHARDGETQIEPLAALYRCEAFMRVGLPVLAAGHGSILEVIENLKTRYVDVADERIFTNVNTPADYDAVAHALT